MIYKKNFLPSHLMPRIHPLETRTKTTYNHTYRDFRDPYGAPSARPFPPSDTENNPNIDPAFYGTFIAKDNQQQQSQTQQQQQQQQQPQYLQQPPPPPPQQIMNSPREAMPAFNMPQSAMPTFNMPQSALPSINNSYQPMYNNNNSNNNSQQQQQSIQQYQQPQQLSAILPISAPVRTQPPLPPPPQQIASGRMPIRAGFQERPYQERLQPQILSRPQPQQQQPVIMSSDLERQARVRSMERPPMRKSDSELRRESNRLQSDSFDNGKPSNPYWFGRAGPIDGSLPISPSLFFFIKI
jgi:hypothetical protein